MFIESQCPGCDALLRVAAEHAGRTALCPRCGQTYVVPQSDPDTLQRQADPPAAMPPAAAEQPRTQTPPTDFWRLKTPGGLVYGPVDRATLDRWLREGRIAADCQLQQGSTGPWLAAARVFPQVTTAVPPSDSRLSGQPAATRLAAAAYQEPHRGGLILGLALAGLLMLCAPLSFAAWFMGNHDLQKMRAGAMDPAGTGLTEAGRIIGMILSLLWIVVTLAGLFVFLLVIVAHA